MASSSPSFNLIDSSPCGKVEPMFKDDSKLRSSRKSAGRLDPHTSLEFTGTDQVRHNDVIEVNPKTGVITRPVRDKYQVPEDSYPLREKKNKKSIVKRPIEWPSDPEAKAQGQKGDCGDDLTSLAKS